MANFYFSSGRLPSLGHISTLQDKNSSFINKDVFSISEKELIEWIISDKPLTVKTRYNKIVLTSEHKTNITNALIFGKFKKIFKISRTDHRPLRIIKRLIEIQRTTYKTLDPIQCMRDLAIPEYCSIENMGIGNDPDGYYDCYKSESTGERIKGKFVQVTLGQRRSNTFIFDYEKLNTLKSTFCACQKEHNVVSSFIDIEKTINSGEDSKKLNAEAALLLENMFNLGFVVILKKVPDHWIVKDFLEFSIKDIGVDFNDNEGDEILNMAIMLKPNTMSDLFTLINSVSESDISKSVTKIEIMAKCDGVSFLCENNESEVKVLCPLCEGDILDIKNISKVTIMSGRYENLLKLNLHINVKIEKDEEECEYLDKELDEKIISAYVKSSTGGMSEWEGSDLPLTDLQKKQEQLAKEMEEHSKRKLEEDMILESYNNAIDYDNHINKERESSEKESQDQAIKSLQEFQAHPSRAVVVSEVKEMSVSEVDEIVSKIQQLSGDYHYAIQGSQEKEDARQKLVWMKAETDSSSMDSKSRARILKAIRDSKVSFVGGSGLEKPTARKKRDLCPKVTSSLLF